MRKILSIFLVVLLLPIAILAKFYLNIYPVSVILLFLPAFYAPLTAPASKLFNKPHPLDNFKMYKGKRLLGNGKTVEGTLIGIFSAVVVGLILDEIWLGLIFGIGAMLGDILNSFMKRRRSYKSGEHSHVFDELNFLFFPVLYGILYLNTTLLDIVILIIFAYTLHFIFDKIALKLGVKNRNEI